MFADAIADIAAGVVTETGGGGLEVDGALNQGQVRARQIGGTSDELGDFVEDLGEDSFGQFSRGDGRVGRAIYWEVLLPSLGEVTLLAADEVVVLGLVLLGVLGEQLVPLLLLGSTLSGNLVADVVDLLGNDEALLGVEAESLLQLLNIISLEGSTVDTVGALELGAETNGRFELDEGRLVLDLLGLLDGGRDLFKVVITILDGEGVPAVGLIALENIFGEGDIGVAVDGDMVVIPDGNQVTELEMASEGAGLARHSLLETTVAQKADKIPGLEEVQEERMADNEMRWLTSMCSC